MNKAKENIEVWEFVKIFIVEKSDFPFYIFTMQKGESYDRRKETINRKSG